MTAERIIKARENIKEIHKTLSKQKMKITKEL